MTCKIDITREDRGLRDRGIPSWGSTCNIDIIQDDMGVAIMCISASYCDGGTYKSVSCEAKC